MKKAHLLMIGSTLLLAGCGDHFNGTYSGTETYSNPSMPVSTGAASSGPVTITISGSDSSRSVHWVGQFGSGQSSTGTSNGNTLTAQMAMQDVVPGFSSVSSGSTNNYNMNINVSDSNQLTASGTSTGSSTPTTGSFSPYNSGIGATRAATANQTSN